LPKFDKLHDYRRKWPRPLRGSGRKKIVKSEKERAVGWLRDAGFYPTMNANAFEAVRRARVAQAGGATVPGCGRLLAVVATLNGPVANNTTFKWWDLVG
jgi:hypothetical protein